MPEYSPEPWRECCLDCSAIEDANGVAIASFHFAGPDADDIPMIENKARVIAAINSARGIPTDVLQQEHPDEELINLRLRRTACYDACRGDPELVPELVAMLNEIIIRIDGTTLLGDPDAVAVLKFRAQELLNRIKQ